MYFCVQVQMVCLETSQ